MTRLNLLVLMADQLADPWLDVAVTPHLDRLVTEGVRFTNAYSNHPLCAPARYAMMSGRLASRIGAWDNAAELPAAVPTFAHHLRAAGYRTILSGKMHFVGPDQLHGYEERLTTDIYPADFGWTPDWDAPDHRFDQWFHDMSSVTDAGVAVVSNQLDFDDDVCFQAVRAVRDLARTDDDRPWMLTVSFTHPHDPYVARRRFWDLYDAATIPMPTVPPIDHPDPHSARLAHVIGAEAADVADEQIRNARRAYLANTTYVDACIGEVLDSLRDVGIADDTAIVFCADHGDLLGERGLWYKMSFFEPSVRIPLVVHAPGRLTPRVVTAPTSLLDVAPTLLDLAGLDTPTDLDGTSLVGLASGEGRDHCDRTVLGEYFGEGSIAPVLMIRRGHDKFVWCPADPPQLYDLAVDPHELDNRAGDEPVTEAFTAEVHERWDLTTLDAAVRASQRDRRLVAAASREGRRTHWDHAPTFDASDRYMRNHLDLGEVERTRRR